MSEPQTTDEENESPRTVRITFIILAFAAGCLLLPPRQWVSAGMMGGVTLLLAFLWRADLKSWWEEGKDDRDAKKAPAPKALASRDEAPAVRPVAEEPKTEEPKTEEPKTEEPKTEDRPSDAGKKTVAVSEPEREPEPAP